MSYLTGGTSFIFRISAGVRDNKMCSKTSEGSSDIEMEHIVNLACNGAGESRFRIYPRFVLVTRSEELFNPEIDRDR